MSAKASISRMRFSVMECPGDFAAAATFAAANTEPCSVVSITADYPQKRAAKASQYRPSQKSGPIFIRPLLVLVGRFPD
jgi:hypothetical protein